MKFDVSIIIVNYHTSSFLINCINSIIRFTHGVSYEIIIVDNDSEPNLNEILTQKVNKSVKHELHLIRMKQNVGFGKANNEGAAKAHGRNLFFLNPDTELLNNAVKILSDFLDAHPICGACGGNLYEHDNLPTLSFRRIMPGLFWECDQLLNEKLQGIRFGKNRTFNYTQKPISVGYITGADLMIKHSVFKNLGGFDNNFFMYFEETHLCKKIRDSQLSIYNVPSAKIYHFESASFKKTDNTYNISKIQYQERSRHIYYLKTRGHLYRFIADKIYFLFLQSRILLTTDKRKKSFYKSRKEYHLTIKLDIAKQIEIV